jgi:UDP-N-acetylmuramate dehydrogenase
MTPPPDLDVRARVPLAPLTTLGVGGDAEHFLEARSEDDVVAALAWARARAMPLWILGGGSNVVIADAGLPGLVVHMALGGVATRPRGDRVEVTAAAGEPWDAFVARCVAEGWAGLECLSAIPGRVGATPVQNVGAYGQEVSSAIARVRALDQHTGEIVTFDRDACGFAYRDSRFKSREPGRHVVLGVTFTLVPGGAPTAAYPELERHLSATEGPMTLEAVRRAVIEIRTRKSMAAGHVDENARSCGSFFVNPIVGAPLADRVARAATGADMPRYPQPDGRVKLSAAWLIEHAGHHKGERHGAVGLSTRHALAIVCHEGATAAAVVALSQRIAGDVQERFGVRLVPEPNLWTGGDA